MGRKVDKIEWIGDSYDQDLSEIKRLRHRHNLVFYE